MALPNIFNPSVSNNLIERVNHLSPNTEPLWGKMNVSKMLAHCNITYELAYDNKHPKPNLVMRFILKTLVKKGVTNEIPYKHSLRTAPVFLISSSRDFEAEKNRLIEYIKKTQQLGEAYFDNRESHSFGPLIKTEWNNMFYKHLNHHLNQFGV